MNFNRESRDKLRSAQKNIHALKQRSCSVFSLNVAAEAFLRLTATSMLFDLQYGRSSNMCLVSTWMGDRFGRISR
jgi:hypothetical protein